ncbi:hypothetical protein [Empedobacter sedimenti]|uniref:hypothetical protein n=1 Tax=Empedobacter sedimenti TaxID=3042610 RepID=UPI0024A715C6|nr:hypothetical protein [Empedobacter sedimenti]
MKYLTFIFLLFQMQIFAQTSSKCEVLAANALYNSTYVKNLTKDWNKLIKENGGTHYGLQVVDTDDHIYRFVLVQHYPDRDYNANWFTISTINKIAFEESMVDPEYNKFFNINEVDFKKLKKCRK